MRNLQIAKSVVQGNQANVTLYEIIFYSWLVRLNLTEGIQNDWAYYLIFYLLNQC